MKRITFLSLLSLCAACQTFLACSQEKKAVKNTKNQVYNLQEKESFKLPEALHEISGIALYQGDPSLFYAQEDELGRIYTFSLPAKEYKAYSVAKDADYEDIALNDSHIFMLQSNGTVVSIAREDLEKNIPATTQKDLVPKAEYEGLAFSADKQELIMLCKECKVDRKTKSTTAYRFKVSPDGVLTLLGEQKIDYSALKSEKPFKKTFFKPSALAQHPQSKDWYLLSAINQTILVADEHWQVKDFYLLEGKDFPQPEGITFDRDNKLYISNEAADKSSNGSLLIFSPKQ